MNIANTFPTSSSLTSIPFTGDYPRLADWFLGVEHAMPP
jgi:hypothetical protein